MAIEESFKPEPGTGGYSGKAQHIAVVIFNMYGTKGE